jgi:hypothetical protein
MTVCAEDSSGLKLRTEDRVPPEHFLAGGRRALPSGQSQAVRLDELMASENVGMSNRNLGESPRGRKPKVSLAMVISQGLGGPKARGKPVADG